MRKLWTSVTCSAVCLFKFLASWVAGLRGSSEPRLDSSGSELKKRVQRFDPALFKVCGVSRDDGERVAAGGGGDLAVQGGDGHTCFFPFRLELTPDMGGAGVEAENAALHAIAEGLEPCAELGFAFAVGQALDSPADFADGDGADVELAFVLTEPLDNPGVRLGFCLLAEDVGIDEVVQNVRGAESSFSLAGISNEAGQESRRSTKPRFAGCAMRLSVMVSSSSTVTSKSSPA